MKFGCRPTYSAYRRSSIAPKRWNVLSHTRSPGASSATRRCISSAALLVNVSARICDGRHAAFEQVGDAVGDDAGLAAARPGQHQQRPVAVRHGLALRLGE